ncbi:hypothetical protein J6590_093783 [Homalodisca vitripennis]|nr:hypothetical protein J6590_093783 [Homalodisca vitripennis]
MDLIRLSKRSYFKSELADLHFAESLSNGGIVCSLGFTFVNTSWDEKATVLDYGRMVTNGLMTSICREYAKAV